MTNLLLRRETYLVIGAAMEVYNTLGPGFLEAVYQEALEVEMAAQRITFEPQKELLISYKSRLLKKTYVADLIAFDRVIVEIKALNTLTSREEAQLLNYLKATGHPVGLLINFGAAGKLEWKGMAWTKK
jgi:GxxExxY protein